MLNPDRIELGPKPSQIPENPSINRYIPRWFREYAFATRAFLAILTATPAMVATADAITHIQNPSVVYAADTPSGKLTKIERVEDCLWHVYIEATGLSPNSRVRVSNINYDMTYCPTGVRYVGDWGPADVGMADSAGRFRTFYIHYTYGTYHFIIEDDAKHRIQIDVAYSKSQIPINTPIPTATRIPTNTPRSTETPMPIPTATKIPKPEPTNTELPKPTSTPKSESTHTPFPPTPTPDVLATPKAELASAQKAAVAVNTRLALAQEQADANATITAAQEKINALRGTPTQTPISTPTPTPDVKATAAVSATVQATKESGQATRIAVMRETATAEAKRPAQKTVEALETQVAEAKADATAKATQSITPTPRPAISEFRPTQVAPIGQPTTPTGIPDWLWGLGTASLAGLAAYWGYRRGKLKNSPPPPSGIGGVGGPSNPNTSPSAGPTQQNTPGATGRGPNPNTGPSTAPSTGPAQPKNPEWVIGQKDFERRWQATKSKLPPLRPGDTGNEQGYILDRFKAGMSIVHEVSLEDATNVPEMDTRIRAGIEYLTAEIWPDKRIFRRFFDPGFNAGLLTPEDLAKIIYIPEPYCNLSSFTKAQKRDIMRIHRTLLHALHPDLLKADSDPKLQDSIDILLRQLNSAWPLINKLLS